MKEIMNWLNAHPVIYVAAGVLAALYIVALWFIFKKAGKESWKSLVPFYNLYTLFETVWTADKFYSFLTVTGVLAALSVLLSLLTKGSGVAYVLTAVWLIYTYRLFVHLNLRLGREFGKTDIWSAFLLCVLGPVGHLILAFNGSQFGRRLDNGEYLPVFGAIAKLVVFWAMAAVGLVLKKVCGMETAALLAIPIAIALTAAWYVIKAYFAKHQISAISAIITTFKTLLFSVVQLAISLVEVSPLCALFGIALGQSTKEKVLLSLAISLPLAIVVMWARWRMFKKSGVSGYDSIIPVFNKYRLFQIGWSTDIFWVWLVPFALNAVVFVLLAIVSAWNKKVTFQDAFKWFTGSWTGSFWWPWLLILAGLGLCVALVLLIASRQDSRLAARWKESVATLQEAAGEVFRFDVVKYMFVIISAAALILTPFVSLLWVVKNPVIELKNANRMAHRFGKSTAFGVVLLFLLAPIGHLLLGFGKADYEVSRDWG